MLTANATKQLPCATQPPNGVKFTQTPLHATTNTSPKSSNSVHNLSALSTKKTTGRKSRLTRLPPCRKFSGLNAEAKQHREAKEAAEAKLKAFDVIEDAAALKAG